MKNSKWIMASLLFGVSFCANSADFNYNYIEVGISSTEIEGLGFEVDGNTVALSGSFEISDDAYIGLGYATSDVDFDIEINTLAFGLGGHSSISETTDIYAQFSILNMEIEQPYWGYEDDSGHGIDVGFRHAVSDKFELNGEFVYVDIFDDSEIGFNAGGRFKLNDYTSFAIIYGVADNTTSVGFSLRSEF